MNQIIGQNLTVTQVIQLMLAPAVMINACGLLILGINNKYSIVVNRIRLLNEEKRRLALKAGERIFTYEENVRLESLAKQLKELVFRVKLVRNCVLCYTTAVALFVLTSLLIAMDFYNNDLGLKNVIIASFLMGMIVVFIGVGFAFFETKKAYDIVQYEVRADE
ncbi:MAG: DUF2721 domain-containing protein [Bacteroidota bacterium]|nr:DUF2721 domain-containing protein [Bacteroidota bacterium]MDP4189959.1 DUF2721 domain-containing protein [Bacteroidota bacterium]MDP4194484.1 DUF2721 domain-containing protein [Bacteroidota bacterium]